MEIKFLHSDFKKREGFKRSTQLCEIYGLYRQDYCGCIFSKGQTETKSGFRVIEKDNLVSKYSLVKMIRCVFYEIAVFHISFV